MLKQETIRALQYRECDTLEEYLQDLSDEYGVPYELVSNLAELLGESELFDGLVNAVEDAERMNCW